MKAVLLAAGVGSRLKPLTDTIPKCLVPIGPDPLLKVWLEHLARFGVSEVLINTHHLPEVVEEFARSWKGQPAIHLVYEQTLLGSAGTLRSNWDFVAGEKDFFVCYADNLTDVDLRSLLAFHESHTGLLTMTLFEAKKPEECGIVALDGQGVVTSFEEKPARPKTELANAGVYVMRSDIYPYLPTKSPADIGFDLLPRCLGRMFGWKWHGFLVDIGTPAAYRRASDMWCAR